MSIQDVVLYNSYRFDLYFVGGVLTIILKKTLDRRIIRVILSLEDREMPK